MYRVMIVDDEKPARELLKLLGNWADYGFSIVAEAEDGAEAFEKWQSLQPDLIFCDIQMPVMNGIELLTKIREQDKNQIFVILSCHEVFSYALAALRLGAFDYIIKDTASAELINLILHEAHQMLTKRIPDVPVNLSTPETAVNKADSNELHYFITIIRFEAEDYLDEESAAILCKGFQVLSIPHLTHTCDYRGNGIFSILAATNANPEQIPIQQIQFTASDKFREVAGQVTHIPVTMGFSSTFSEIEQMSHYETEALQTMKSSIFLGCGKTHFSSQAADALNSQADILEARLEELKNALNANQADKVRSQIHHLFKKDYSGFVQLNYTRYLIRKLIHILFQAAVENAITYSDVLGPEWLKPGLFDVLTDIEQIKTSLIALFDHYFQLLEKKGKALYSYRIRKVIEYIQSNYTGKISLETVANTFKIHKVHLARTFKDEVGCSVNEYIMKLRMEKARYLLTQTNLKIGEIASACGFQSTQSFFISFKNNNQLSPSDYRNQTSLGLSMTI